MDFKLVFERLLTAFEKYDIKYALIGGFALGLFGGGRTTLDLDFLVDRGDMEKVDTIMQGLGYECKYKTENVSQYVSPLKVFGEIDFLYAFRSPSLSMLQRAEEKKIFNETVPIMVLTVEDLIGLKVQAIANDESRKAIDLPDIESLIAMHKKTVNWLLIEEYFTLFGFKELLTELRIKYGSD